MNTCYAKSGGRHSAGVTGPARPLNSSQSASDRTLPNVTITGGNLAVTYRCRALFRLGNYVKLYVHSSGWRFAHSPGIVASRRPRTQSTCSASGDDCIETGDWTVLVGGQCWWEDSAGGRTVLQGERLSDRRDAPGVPAPKSRSARRPRADHSRGPRAPWGRAV